MAEQNINSEELKSMCYSQGIPVGNPPENKEELEQWQEDCLRRLESAEG